MICTRSSETEDHVLIESVAAVGGVKGKVTIMPKKKSVLLSKIKSGHGATDYSNGASNGYLDAGSFDDIFQIPGGGILNRYDHCLGIAASFSFSCLSSPLSAMIMTLIVLSLV